MDKYRIIRGNGKVMIKDDFTTSLTFNDDEHISESIKANPHIEFWEKMDILRKLGLK